MKYDVGLRRYLPAGWTGRRSCFLLLAALLSGVLLDTAQAEEGLLAVYSTGPEMLEGPINHGWNWSCTSTNFNQYQNVCTSLGESPVDWADGGGFSVTWTGYVYAPAAGEYTFRGWQDGTVYLKINNEVLWDTNATGGHVIGEVTLPASTWVPLYMTYAPNGGSNNLALNWIRPDVGVQELIPRRYFATSDTGKTVYQFDGMRPMLPQPWYFNGPYANAADTDGNVYVADAFANRVQKFDRNGAFVTKWGSPGAGAGQFEEPKGIAVSKSGEVYVADTGNNRVQKFDANGNFVTQWGGCGFQPGKLCDPTGIDVNSQGDVYVSDTYEYSTRIQKFSSDGAFILEWGDYGSSNGQFIFPSDVAVDDLGNVYVADTLNNRIQKFNSDGAYLLQWGGAGAGDGLFASVSSVAVDGAGNVYAVDRGNNRVQKFNDNGIWDASWGTGGSGDGEFSIPRGISAYASPQAGGAIYIYVADTGNNRIQKLDTEGNHVSSWASSGEFKYPTRVQAPSNLFLSFGTYVLDSEKDRVHYVDNFIWGKIITWGTTGSGQSQFDNPMGLATALEGPQFNTTVWVYVADTGNDRIQKFGKLGAFAWESGGSGSGPGQFNEPTGIAVDSAGNLYIADEGNHRVQKLNSAGVYASEFSAEPGHPPFSDFDITVRGSYVYVLLRSNSRVQKYQLDGTFVSEWVIPSGAGDGQLEYPAAIEADLAGNLYLTDFLTHRIQKFDSGFGFLESWGGFGFGPGQLNRPFGLDVNTKGDIYVADVFNFRVQVFRPVSVLGYDKAVIVAGRKATDDILWPATQKVTADAYRTLRFRGLGTEQIRYLSHNSPLDLDEDGINDVDDVPTSQSVQDALTTWASATIMNDGLPIQNVIVYLADHGGPDTYYLSEDATLDAGTLNGWLNTLESSILGKPIVVLDSCYSGSFLNTLKKSGRIIVTSTEPDEVAYFQDNGVASFSGFFWQQVLFGRDLKTVFSAAEVSMDTGGLPQHPQVDADGDGAANEPTDDLDALADTYIGSAVEAASELPTISDVFVTGLVGSTATLSAVNVFDADLGGSISRVFAKIQPPGFGTTDWEGNPILGLPEVTLDLVSGGGTCSPETVGSWADGSFSGANRGRGNTVYIQQYDVLTKIEMYLDVPSTATLYWFVYENAAATGTFSKIFETSTVSGTGAQFYSSGSISVPVQAGTYYLIGAWWGGQTVTYGRGTESVPIGVSVGQVVTGIPSSPSASAPPATWDFAITGFSPYYSRLTFCSDGNNYAAEYDGFTKAGTYNVTFHAMDNYLYLGEPKSTTISVGSPLHRRAVLVAGGSLAHQQWPAYQRSYARAFVALKQQLYDDSDIMVFAHANVVPTTEGVTVPTLQGITGTGAGTVRGWVGSNTQDLTIYLVGPGSDELFQLNDDEYLGSPAFSALLNVLHGSLTAGGTLTVVMDACSAGSFADNIHAADRILVMSTGEGESARFVEEDTGMVSFSEFFWTRTGKGDTVELAYLRVRDSMAAHDQVPGLDDNGDGLLSQVSDGSKARYYRIGHGVILGADEPVVREAIEYEELSGGTTSATLWANGVFSPGRSVTSVWASIAPPGYGDSGGVCQALLTRIPLGSGVGHDYEALYDRFTQEGDYQIKIYCTDNRGNTSAAKSAIVRQMETNLGDSTPPEVTLFKPENGVTAGVALFPVIRFTVTDTGSGVDINGITLTVNGINVSKSLQILGTPGSYAVRYSPWAGFIFGADVHAVVTAADLDGNVQGPLNYHFTVTNGVDGNGDGMADDWAAYYSIGSGGGNPDGDQYTNAEEAELGTDPSFYDSLPTGPDNFEEDDTHEDARWANLNDAEQVHTFHDRGDVDWVVFHATGDMVLNLRTLDLGPDADTTLEVYAEGDYVTPVATDDNPGYPAAVILSWDVPSTGYYYVKIRNDGLKQYLYGANAYYAFKVEWPTGGPNITAKISNAVRPGQVGKNVALNGSFSSDGGKVPVSWAWSFVRYPAALPSLTVVNNSLAYFTPAEEGLYVVKLRLLDDQGLYSEARAYITVGETSAQVWVDFNPPSGYPEADARGTADKPFREIWRAEDKISPAGTISIVAGDTSETPTLGETGKAFQMVAVGGTVRIGVAGKQAYAPQSADAPAASPFVDVAGLFAQLAGKIAPAEDTVNRIWYDQTTYEPVIPFTRTAEGVQAAQAESPLAIRLRSDAAIDPDSIWGPIPGYTQAEAAAEWQPVTEGDMRDIWVVCKPTERWYLEDVIGLSAGAETVGGEAVTSEPFTFQVETEAAYAERETMPLETEPQPVSSGEAPSDAVVTQTGDGEVALPLGVSDPYTIGPEQVYDTPQRVWLKLPQGVAPEQVQVYYYHPHGDDRGWYPAENVEGWLVPDSYLNLRQGGETYLGFLVQHAGIVQLGIAGSQSN